MDFMKLKPVSKIKLGQSRSGVFQSRKTKEKKKKYTSTGHEFEIYVGLRKGSSNQYVKNAVQKLKNMLTKEGVIGYTEIKARGYWKGKGEPTLVISFVNTYNITSREVYALARKIKNRFQQEEILVVKDRVDYRFVK